MNNPNELTKETTMTSNEEIIRNLYAVAEKEPKKFRSLFTGNGYWWDVPAGVKYNGDEIARAADIYSAAFPDMHRKLSKLYFDGDVVVVELTLNGTHRGDLPMGLGTLPATGKEFHIPCIDVFHIEDGKVSAFDCHYAGTIMLGQLGVLGNLEASLRNHLIKINLTTKDAVKHFFHLLALLSFVNSFFIIYHHLSPLP